MRCYQEVGLKESATKWLNKNAEFIVTRKCPKCDCGQDREMHITKIEHIDSFYGDGPCLRTIRLLSGQLVKEVVQAEPWSSGPVAFFCLEIDGTRMFEWTDEEIETF